MPHTPSPATGRLPASFPLASVAMAAALLVGCGGGGSADTGTTANDPAPAVVFSGVAATGAPMPGAHVVIVDAGGHTACDTTTDDSGHYRCTLAATAQAPFAITASTADQTLYSGAPAALTGTVNVTPLTTLIIARLTPSGDPARFAAAIQADPGVASSANVAARVAEVQALIAPLGAAAGAVVDPLNGTFSADGTGHDKVLDALQITIRPEGSVSNIEVTMKVAPSSNDAPPLSVTFKSNETTPPPPVTTIAPAALAATGVASQVADFLERMHGCYALPLAERIAGVAAGATAASGDAGAVQAPACRSLFVGNDPAGYLDGGLHVGSGQAFAGMFRDSSTGAAFDRGNYEYQWANGDVLITFRSTTTVGAVNHSTLTLRSEAGQLKAVGNHYAYEASVRPYVFDREFGLQPAFNYLGTGYNVGITNRVDSAGNPVFSQAVVTTPTGRQLVYRPLAGRAQLALVRSNGDTSGTSVEVFAAAYVDPTTPGSPKDKDTSLVFASEPQTDEQLRSIPDQGVWTVEFVHADTSLPNVRQVYRTIERASTIGEVRLASFAQFTAEMKAQWLARTDVQSGQGITFGTPSTTAPNVVRVGPEGDLPGWTLPDGAAPVTVVNVFGQFPTNSRFNDSASVASTDRRATVQCSRQSNADLHCDSSTGAVQFAAGGHVYTLELWGRTLRQVERVKHMALWRLPE